MSLLLWTQTKKLKQEIQKAATIPVSQISSNSGSQVKELYDKIDQLLSGQPVMLEGKSVSTSMHPQAQNFAFYKVAEKFVVSPHPLALDDGAIICINLTMATFSSPRNKERRRWRLTSRLPFPLPWWPLASGSNTHKWES